MRAIELFAGAGGLGIGVSRAGFKAAQVVEWNRYCCDTLRDNKARQLSPIKDWPLLQGDVRDVDFHAFEDKVELVSGGPPCQPFSVGGKHGAHNDVRDMFPEAVRAVRTVRPLAKRSRLQPMKDAARTVERLRDGILARFDSRIANGLIEGINNLVQSAKAKAHGYRSIRNLKAIC